MKQHIKEYMIEQLEKLLSIPSPTGYTKEVSDYLMTELQSMGYAPYTLNKGGVVCQLNEGDNTLMLAAHVDTLGAMVKTIKGNGALVVTPLGGLNASNVETETAWVITRDGKKIEGTFQVENASSHVNRELNNIVRSFDSTLELLLDEKVHSKDDTKKLGIETGDIVAVNPRFTITESGFIKSRFLDDKASAAVLLTLAKALKDGSIAFNRKVYIDFTVYEEVGHGAATGIPADVKDMISVDMGCIGNGLNCTETQVSICAKDSSGPYNYDVVSDLINAAKKAGADYAVDIYPFYGSDVDVSLKAGYDVRHGLIGPGVYASHGYERSHIDGLVNTYKLLEEYLR
ncbi:MAG: M42 family metallopeptidase [Oscillospiraceae bacterium]|nr:M42 family metallopeptidase [Oscillospiraceae bacterium]